MTSGVRIPVGYVRRAHGVRGAVILRPLTDRPEERFVAGAEFSTDESEPRLLRIESAAQHVDGFIISFTRIDDRDQAAALRGVSLTIGASERRPLESDEFWPDQLVGCTALDRSGAVIGVIESVASGGAQNRLVLKTTSGNTVELPFVEALVPEVDVEGRTVVVDPPEGLFT